MLVDLVHILIVKIIQDDDLTIDCDYASIRNCVHWLMQFMG